MFSMVFFFRRQFASPVDSHIVATLIHCHCLCHGNDRPLVEKTPHYNTILLGRGLKFRKRGKKLTFVATYGAASF